MLKRFLAGFARQVRRLAVLATVTVVAGTSWSWLTGNGDANDDSLPLVSEAAAPATGHAWGDEMLSDIHKHVVAGLPIRVANACGLGASSCFRCHNGKRAEAPAVDPVKNPWHVDHAKVNNSCGGCHQGNPRLMKKDIAHKKLVGNPAMQPETSCFSCHTSADAQGLVDAYQKLTNATGE